MVVPAIREGRSRRVRLEPRWEIESLVEADAWIGFLSGIGTRETDRDASHGLGGLTGQLLPRAGWRPRAPVVVPRASLLGLSTEYRA